MIIFTCLITLVILCEGENYFQIDTLQRSVDEMRLKLLGTAPNSPEKRPRQELDILQDSENISREVITASQLFQPSEISRD